VSIPESFTLRGPEYLLHDVIRLLERNHPALASLPYSLRAALTCEYIATLIETQSAEKADAELRDKLRRRATGAGDLEKS